MNKKGMNQIILVIIFLILIVGAGIGGYFLGQHTMLNSLYPEPNEVFSISGKITSIDGNSLVVETSSLERYIPGQEFETKLITINTNQQTKIYKLNFSPENPTEFTETVLSFSDLAVGDAVGILSSENIKGKSQVTATEITLQLSASNITEEFPV